MRSSKWIGGLAVCCAIVLLVGCEALAGLFEGPYGQNTTLERAYEIELGVTYDARIRDNDSAQYFVFDTAHVPETWDRVRVRITVPDSSLKVQVARYDENGERVGGTHATTGGQNVDYEFVCMGGRYYLRFSGGTGYGLDHASSGRYSFVVENLDDNDDYGPNHSRETAFSIETGVEYNGVILANSEADYFVLELENVDPSDHYQVIVTDVGETIYLRIRLYREDGEQFYTNHTTTRGAILGVPAVYNFGDTLWIRFSGDTGYGLDHASTGSYSFKVEEL